MLRNPFGIQDGKIVTISDLTPAQRGAGCNCQCPNCKGPLIAKMGNIKVHHFAHSKDACDEIATFISGLLQIVRQSIEENGSVYVPALIVGYKLPWQGLTLANIEHYTTLLSEQELIDKNNAIKLADGKIYAVDSIRIISNAKSFAEALLLNIKDRSIAIQILPPKTACRANSLSPALNASTLVLNVENVDFHTVTSSQLRKIVMEKSRWRWIVNAKRERGLILKYLPNFKNVKRRNERKRKNKKDYKKSITQRCRRYFTPGL